ncbi:MAG: tRNA 2-thiouridine(34) synthase MnmA [Paludibacteraceae bacterium]|nr:tRNA 2-thiouridine(34) synthase MnmA [Paludibacteraceae bacterium]
MAMSGGIDSSVAAMLLLEQGYELVGVTFRTFDSIKESCLVREKGCCSVESIMEAKHLAQKLGFEHHILDYRQIFKDTVIKNFVEEYSCGRTPNPCVLCNSHIKWGEMIKAADNLGCDLIATGHYAQIEQFRGHWYLKNAIDKKKDQTYFLWMLTEDNLKRTIFPLGGLEKTQVRNLAAQHGYEQLSKKSESQEICFIPNNDYRTFLQDQGIRISQGEYVDAQGKVLGRHEGYQNYTIGQRKGLGIALGEPKFVVKIDASNNRVTLGSHDDLLSCYIHATDVRLRDKDWLLSDPQVEVRIRYRSAVVKARIESFEGDRITIETQEPVWGITPGQSLVIYKNSLLVGGGIITN